MATYPKTITCPRCEGSGRLAGSTSSWVACTPAYEKRHTSYEDVTELCPTCEGKGWVGDVRHPSMCSECGGRKSMPTAEQRVVYTGRPIRPCNKCDGAGLVVAVDWQDECNLLHLDPETGETIHEKQDREKREKAQELARNKAYYRDKRRREDIQTNIALIAIGALVIAGIVLFVRGIIPWWGVPLVPFGAYFLVGVITVVFGVGD